MLSDLISSLPSLTNSIKIEALSSLKGLLATMKPKESIWTTLLTHSYFIRQSGMMRREKANRIAAQTLIFRCGASLCPAELPVAGRKSHHRE